MASETLFKGFIIRTCLLYGYNSGVKAAEWRYRNCVAFCINAVLEHTAQDWFKRFCGGDTNIEDRSRSGRPSKIDEDFLLQMIKADPHKTSSDLASDLAVSYRTVIKHLHAIGKVSKLDQSVPYSLSDWDRKRHIEVAVSLRSYRQPLG